MKPILIEQPESEAASQSVGAVELPPNLLHHKHLLFNRELSWLEFNRRVLEEALDETQPLLERLKFLAIFSTNLDEFFMIRVSGLKEELEEEIHEPSPDGMTPAEQLKQISEQLRPMVAAQMRCLTQEILPALETEGISVTPYKELTTEEQQALDTYFMENVFPVLTPQAVDPGHPFPYISNLSLNLGLMIEPAEAAGEDDAEHLSDELRFARVKIPPLVSRLVPVGDTDKKFTLLGDVVAANIDELFPGMRSSGSYLFRVTRDADIEIREDEAGDLLRMVEQQLRKRRFGDAVRLEVSDEMPPEMVASLTKSLDLTDDDVYRIEGPLNVPDFMRLYGLESPELKDKPLQTSVPAPLAQGQNIFDVIRQQDILLHHPYTAYSTVVEFIQKAALDPDVLAIKICLYRAGQNSPIVPALIEASE
ncbi:MAG: polyphosphate kinase, partial [Pyrinomonadaceae bacterium]|nr:polyphosphate kinase [Pyrinomonadaceae bacterium]